MTPAPDQPPQLFIGYASKTLDCAQILLERLTPRGHRVGFDKQRVSPRRHG